MKKKNEYACVAHATQHAGKRNGSQAWSTRGGSPLRGARARWHSCKNVLALSDNSMNTTRTISIDNDFTTEPTDLLLFTMARPSTIPARVDATNGGTGAYVHHMGPPLTYLQG